MEDKLLKLMEKEEALKKKKEKIEEELRKVAKQIKDVEHQQKVRNIEDSIVVLSNHGINLNDVIKEIQQGRFDHLKKASADAGGNVSGEVGAAGQG
ncbi:hypothetical protein P4H61_12485 [Paenibacillus peoriae]|uniref:hypothetical protein n=1 Tax=Paenibacillus peoriae TaxID=59893 RepID=UPI00026C688D|nr:hypothetical protein [Paenibacillus peoriae]MEC0182299.1 hypothetical protein [Paenibacillus peoriae]